MWRGSSVVLWFALLPCSGMAVGVIVSPLSEQSSSRHSGFLPHTKHTLIWLNWNLSSRVNASGFKWSTCKGHKKSFTTIQMRLIIHDI